MPALFVYGTLRPGGSNHGLLEGTADRAELAHADGLSLWATRGFPYAAPDPGTGARITGTLCWITGRAWIDALSRLDMLEGYDPARESDSHYLRRCWPVTTVDGDRVEAWLYLAGPRVNLNALPLIPGGDWLHQPATHRPTTT